MKNKQIVITEIRDRNSKKRLNSTKWEIREAARGILLNSNNKIAVINVSKCGYYKLPGGGIDDPETPQKAFIREIKEETGYSCKLIKNNFQGSLILETRNKLNFFQISHIFFSKVVSKEIKNLMPDEIRDGFKLEWFTLDKAIEIIQKYKTNDYRVKFVRKRDLATLKFYKLISI